jgi:hypothetical protein
MKSLTRHLYKCIVIATCLLAFVNQALAQGDDAIMIPKNYLCSGVMYSNSSWKSYWEGAFKRDNANIGTVNTNMYALMTTYGITNDFNATLNIPYVTTNASAGTLRGQKGVQDLSLILKLRALKRNFGNTTLSVFAIGTASIPVGGYEADFYPLALGSHSKNFMVRALLDYRIGKYFITGSGAYMSRSNITIDRNSYYTTQLIYSNQVELPNMNDFNFRTGYRSKSFIAEVVVDKSTSLGGFDIRKNDMPFPSNNMNATLAGVNFRYTFQSLHGLEVSAGDDYVVRGRNVGQSNMIHGGITYIVGLSKKGSKQ